MRIFSMRTPQFVVAVFLLAVYTIITLTALSKSAVFSSSGPAAPQPPSLIMQPRPKTVKTQHTQQTNASRPEAKAAIKPAKSVTNFAGPMNITASLVSPNKDSIKVGDMIHYRITSRHENSNVLGSAGVFWYATIRSNANPSAGTTGRVVDHNNGTYSVYAYAGWAGEGTLAITRVLSREAVDFMNNTVWPAEDRVVWTGYFNHNGTKLKDRWNINQLPVGLCRLRSRGNYTGKCVYVNKKALGKTVFLCEKPEGVNCDTLYAAKSHDKLISAKVRELARGKKALFESAKLHPKIQIDYPTVRISGPPKTAITTLPQCQPDQKLPVSHGYWFEGSWRSLICTITDWTEQSKLTSCLRKMDVLLFGDSTTRQWFVHILGLLNRKFVRRQDDLNFYWKRYLKDIEMSILISFPKQLVGHATVLLEEVYYEVDLIDELNDTRCNYIILVSPWAHFTQWTRESYTDRTVQLREALIRFRKRCPDAKVVLKGPHARDHKSFDAMIYSNDFIMKGIGEINQKILAGIGVWFLPIWDMNLAYQEGATIHMPDVVIHEEVKMFFSYVCGDSKIPALKV